MYTRIYAIFKDQVLKATAKVTKLTVLIQSENRAVQKSKDE